MEKKGIKGRNGFLKGAAWIAIGGFIAKLIGAVYRIPLTNLIGGHGLGLYQLVYPVYCLLLTVSATGIPSSIAKLTAERTAKGENGLPVFKTAMRLFLLIGVFGTLLMALCAPILAKAQGSEEVLGGYYALAPSVVLVSAISVFRGWFQGRNQMHPTAFSEITEQAVKVGFGLLFAYLYRSNIQKAVVFLLLSVSISELFALFLMLFFYKKTPKSSKDGGRCAFKTVLRLSIPVTLNAILLPISSLLDSVLVPKLLSAYAQDPISLYGLFAGGATTIINLPVSICYGIAAASIPAVSAAVALQNKQSASQSKTNTTLRKTTPSVRKKIGFSLLVTLLVATPCAVGLYLFAEPAVTLIFRSLSATETQTLIALVRAFSVSAVTLSCVQTLSACLTAQGKPLYGAFSMLVGLVLKTVIYLRLLQSAEISVYGMAIATNLCYLVAFFLDLLYNLWVSKRKKPNKKEKDL
ncbi:MAG: polysaccharide biosynthesis protein [Clostridia bacterium]|nr:polysaccharide biosynthesis protein [Clostridia bacterium]